MARILQARERFGRSVDAPGERDGD
jgi:hypothetical protein